MPQTLKGRIALVTGASRGIGRAAAIALGAEGEIKLQGIDAWRRKPGPAEKSAKREWINAVKNVFIGHKRAP